LSQREIRNGGLENVFYFFLVFLLVLRVEKACLSQLHQLRTIRRFSPCAHKFSYNLPLGWRGHPSSMLGLIWLQFLRVSGEGEEQGFNSLISLS